MKKYPALLLFVVLVVASCAPAVPYDQMPGAGGSSNYRATERAAGEAAYWQDVAMSQTAEAPIIRITETAAAISIQGTQAAAVSTGTAVAQNAIATQTAMWWTPTPNVTATYVAAISDAERQALANNAARDTLQLQREERSNEFRADAAELTFYVLLFVTAFYLIQYARRSRFQPMKTDARGNVLPVMDIVKGSYTDPDRNPNYQGSISDAMIEEALRQWMIRKGLLRPKLPEVTAQRQDAATERDQMVDLATRGLPATTAETRENKKLAGQQIVKQISDGNLQSRFKVLEGDAPETGVIDGQIIQVLDNDWKEAKEK